MAMVLTLWRKSTAVAAKLLCTTCVTCGMSMPRAAASVQTMTTPSLQHKRIHVNASHLREHGLGHLASTSIIIRFCITSSSVNPKTMNYLSLPAAHGAQSRSSVFS